MMGTRTFSGWAAAFVFGMLIAGCASSTLDGGGTNTNWLVSCQQDSECPEGGQCACGLCTRTCESDMACDSVAQSSCAGQLDVLGCGASEARVCVQTCSDASDCDGIVGGRCTQGLCVGQAPVSDGPAMCDPLSPRAQPIALGRVLLSAVGHDDVYYLVDEVGGDYRVFTGERRQVVRQRVTGSGEGSGWLLLTFEQAGSVYTLAVELGAARRVALATGEVEREFELVTAVGESLQRLPAPDADELELVNLPGEMFVEYLVDAPGRKTTLAVIRPENDWGYEDFEVYYGPETALVQRAVENVSRARDGGSTIIDFLVDGASVRASFPIAGAASLRDDAGETPLQTRSEEQTADLTFICRAPLPAAETVDIPLQKPLMPAQKVMFPEGNYDDECVLGADDCDAPYECLERPPTEFDAGGGLACLSHCETIADCPTVWSEHCGDQTTCEQGVCGYWACM